MATSLLPSHPRIQLASKRILMRKFHSKLLKRWSLLSSFSTAICILQQQFPYFLIIRASVGKDFVAHNDEWLSQLIMLLLVSLSIPLGAERAIQLFYSVCGTKEPARDECGFLCFHSDKSSSIRRLICRLISKLRPSSWKLQLFVKRRERIACGSLICANNCLV